MVESWAQFMTIVHARCEGFDPHSDIRAYSLLNDPEKYVGNAALWQQLLKKFPYASRSFYDAVILHMRALNPTLEYVPRAPQAGYGASAPAGRADGRHRRPNCANRRRIVAIARGRCRCRCVSTCSKRCRHSTSHDRLRHTCLSLRDGGCSESGQKEHEATQGLSVGTAAGYSPLTGSGIQRRAAGPARRHPSERHCRARAAASERWRRATGPAGGTSRAGAGSTGEAVGRDRHCVARQLSKSGTVGQGQQGQGKVGRVGH